MRVQLAGPANGRRSRRPSGPSAHPSLGTRSLKRTGDRFAAVKDEEIGALEANVLTRRSGEPVLPTALGISYPLLAWNPSFY